MDARRCLDGESVEDFRVNDHFDDLTNYRLLTCFEAAYKGFVEDFRVNDSFDDLTNYRLLHSHPSLSATTFIININWEPLIVRVTDTQAKVMWDLKLPSSCAEVNIINLERKQLPFKGYIG